MATDWSGLSGMEWVGWDGSSWDLLTGGSGIVLVSEGVRGLNMPPVQRYTTASPGVAGSRWRGSRVDEREVFWPLLVHTAKGSSAWADVDRAFWRTMHPEKPGDWRITSPDGKTRTLRCRYSGDGGHAHAADPSRDGVALYGINLVAEAPYWQGQTIERLWASSTSSSFFGSGAPSFTISSANTLGSATMDNPGDVEAYPTWTLNGPIDAATVGTAGKTIDVPFSIASGKSLVIETSPDAMSAIDSDGVDRTAELGNSTFAAIDPGTSVVLSLSVTGSGTVSASLTPLYFRAW